MQDIISVKEQLNEAFASESEHKLLKVLSDNPFLFYHLFKRHFKVQPIFKEVSFGNKYRCDFVWLNDNSDGPEWTIVEVESPGIHLFKKNEDKTAEFNHAIEQVEHWIQFFEENKDDRRKTFGAVKCFRFILVIGTREQWSNKWATRWRMNYNNSHFNFEIRSLGVFMQALDDAEKGRFDPAVFTQQQEVFNEKRLRDYISQCGYLDLFRCLF